jgi:hypothetical protein
MSNRQPHTRTTTQRGFGTAHQRRRAELAKLVDTGRVRCGRCGELIRRGQRWHLDHQDRADAHQRGLYRASPASHAHCNLRARNERIAALARQAEAHGLDVAPEQPAGRWVRAAW